jgi:hypothetical protein
VSTDPGPPKPATTPEVSTDPGASVGTGARAHCQCLRAVLRTLSRGRNAMAIWQDLVDDHGFSARYSSVRRLVVTLRGVAPAEARVVITTEPGQDGQIDYGGDGPMVRDPARASTGGCASSY